MSLCEESALLLRTVLSSHVRPQVINFITGPYLSHCTGSLAMEEDVDKELTQSPLATTEAKILLCCFFSDSTSVLYYRDVSL